MFRCIFFPESQFRMLMQPASLLHYICLLYTSLFSSFILITMYLSDLNINIFLYFDGIRRKGSYILFFFSEREYDDTLFPCLLYTSRCV